jgi:hypothetical protein
VNGNQASAEVIAAVGGDVGDPERTQFVKEGGKWRIVMDGGCDLLSRSSATSRLLAA